nr:immunoglobulin light chain junction region [Macaca mulatta]MOX44303.1 immunoglobulin light chain junction region [Macaca mulatta]MOX45996.1 immunoglobulin light chain junction region [Macaca mulatta]MOX46865.1 immunoglobulin light chain junction region [Macaca mulatta]
DYYCHSTDTSGNHFF